MIAEILSVGTELLMGQIANTDAQYLSQRLGELGVMLYRQTVVGDNPGRVKEALNEALSRSDIVITTGGLGPTADDLTKEMVAEYFGLEMQFHQKSYDALMAYMNKIGRQVTPNNRKQAYFPAGSYVMENLCGTAPGCIVEQNGKAVAVLPGPPHEMQDMFERQLAPYLQKRSGAHIESKFLKVFGIGESTLETMLLDLFDGSNPTLALYCGPGEVMARISAMAENAEKALALIEPMEQEIRARLGNHIYAAEKDATVASAVLQLLKQRGETVSFAESCTGGMLSATLINNPGASSVIGESHVTYANSAKIRVLGVSSQTLEQHGAVSAQCAMEMARGARDISGANWAISVTGIAGPDGGTPEKPVGTVFIGLCGNGVCTAKEFHFRGKRDWVRTLSCSNALNMLRLKLLENV